MVYEDPSNMTETASTWRLVALENPTAEHQSWVDLRSLVRDVDYSMLLVSPTMAFFFFKCPSTATLFKLTFSGM